MICSHPPLLSWVCTGESALTYLFVWALPVEATESVGSGMLLSPTYFVRQSVRCAAGGSDYTLSGVKKEIREKRRRRQKNEVWLYGSTYVRYARKL
jgi:hypothetical protein